ncbi:MAG TPA: D-tyrosyl-tRNA(Tyr) deacylase [Firmicutes bacterium]|nr:D-tyrosyl-tRNA(Tyr) deacylase [Bacillota bacterium]
MRALIQRVKKAEVAVDGEVIGSIGPGMLVLLGVAADDTEWDVQWLAQKTANLRIFDDGAGKMNLSLLDTGGEALIVSQFTLYGDCRRGRRPSFDKAAPPDRAEALYKLFVEQMKRLGVRTATGRFQAMMNVTLENSGPVTVLVESESARPQEKTSG